MLPGLIGSLVLASLLLSLLGFAGLLGHGPIKFIKCASHLLAPLLLSSWLSRLLAALLSLWLFAALLSLWLLAALLSLWLLASGLPLWRRLTLLRVIGIAILLGTLLPTLWVTLLGALLGAGHLHYPHDLDFFGCRPPSVST